MPSVLSLCSPEYHKVAYWTPSYIHSTWLTSRNPHIQSSAHLLMTAILSSHSNPVTASANLQTHLLSIEKWTRKWKIKINEEKSEHVTFSLRRGNCPHLTFNQTIIPLVDEVKYMGLYLDRRITWKCHISTIQSTWT